MKTLKITLTLFLVFNTLAIAQPYDRDDHVLAPYSRFDIFQVDDDEFGTVMERLRGLGLTSDYQEETGFAYLSLYMARFLRDYPRPVGAVHLVEILRPRLGHIRFTRFLWEKMEEGPDGSYRFPYVFRGREVWIGYYPEGYVPKTSTGRVVDLGIGGVSVVCEGSGSEGDELFTGAHETSEKIVRAVGKALGINTMEDLQWNNTVFRGFDIAHVPVSTLDRDEVLAAFDLTDDTDISGKLSILSYGSVPVLLCLRLHGAQARVIELFEYYDMAESDNGVLTTRFIAEQLFGNYTRVCSITNSLYVYRDISGAPTLLLEGPMSPEEIADNAEFIDIDSARRIPVLPGVFHGADPSSLISARATYRYVREWYAARQFAGHEGEMKVLIVGTGSGLEARIASELGAEVDAVDIKQLAVENTGIEIEGIGDNKSINAFKNDLFSGLGEYDLIVMNLPHVGPGVGLPRSEEGVPIDQGEKDTADYDWKILREVSATIASHMMPGGKAVMVNSDLEELILGFLAGNPELDGVSITTDNMNVVNTGDTAYVFTRGLGAPRRSLLPDDKPDTEKPAKKDPAEERSYPDPAKEFIGTLTRYLEFIRYAKNSDKIIIGLDNSWIPEELMSLAGLQGLLNAVYDLGDEGKGGFPRLEIIRGEGQALVDDLKRAADGDYSNVIVFSDEGIIEEGSVFRDLTGEKPENMAFMAGIRSSVLLEGSADLMSYSMLLEMMTMALNLSLSGASGDFVKEGGVTAFRKGPRLWLFIPDAVKMDPGDLACKYERQIEVLANA